MYSYLMTSFYIQTKDHSRGHPRPADADFLIYYGICHQKYREITNFEFFIFVFFSISNLLLLLVFNLL